MVLVHGVQVLPVSNITVESLSALMLSRVRLEFEKLMLDSHSSGKRDGSGSGSGSGSGLARVSITVGSGPGQSATAEWIAEAEAEAEAGGE
jgi:hypothetical protein